MTDQVIETLQQYLKSIWETWAEKNLEMNNQLGVQAVEHPMFWKLLMKNVRTSLEDQSSTYLSEFDTFNESMQKIIKLWTTNFKKWSVATPEQLHDKASKLLAGTYQKSFSSAPPESSPPWSSLDSVSAFLLPMKRSSIVTD